MQTLDDKEFFKHIKKEGNEYSDDITESFPYFCLKIFWNELSKDEIEEALRGLRANEDGIDAFFVDENNNEINIIQCKSCHSIQSRSALKKEWLTYLNGVESKLENHDYIDNHKNDRVKEIAADVITYKKQKYKVTLHLFHLGRIASEKILASYPNLKYYDWNEIKNTYEEYLSKIDRTEPDSIDIQLEFTCLEPLISKKHHTLVSIITGDAIVKLREKHRYKLFDKNLRFGLGKNKINKKIIETTQGEPHNFYFYNNGITITSKRFKYKETNGRLNIQYPQIINGSQTVNSIYDSYIEKLNKLERQLGDKKQAKTEALKEFNKIKLLFRVIQDDEKDGKKNTPFEQNVIRYNNSQNSIHETDFYSNESEQIAIQRIMAKFGYFYEIKRGDRKYLETNKEKHNLLNLRKTDFEYWDEKIDIESLASLWMAYIKDPNLSAVSKSNIFGYAKDKYYDIVFKVKEIDENLVKEMILAYNIINCIENQCSIYGNRTKDGQIIAKLTQLTGDKFDEKIFASVKSILKNNYFLPNKILSDNLSTKDKFLKNRDQVLEVVKRYHFFSLGKYLVLHIFQIIIRECKYTEGLLSAELFSKKQFIDENIVKKWLQEILKKVVEKVYVEFEKETGGSLKSFYTRGETCNTIKKEIEKLPYDEDKQLSEIFPLALK